MFPPGFEDEALPLTESNEALRWLAERIATDPRFARRRADLGGNNHGHRRRPPGPSKVRSAARIIHAAVAAYLVLTAPMVFAGKCLQSANNLHRRLCGESLYHNLADGEDDGAENNSASFARAM